MLWILVWVNICQTKIHFDQYLKHQIFYKYNMNVQQLWYKYSSKWKFFKWIFTSKISISMNICFNEYLFQWIFVSMTICFNEYLFQFSGNGIKKNWVKFGTSKRLLSFLISIEAYWPYMYINVCGLEKKPINIIDEFKMNLWILIALHNWVWKPRATIIKHYRFVMCRFHSKLARFSKPVKVIHNNGKH